MINLEDVDLTRVDSYTFTQDFDKIPVNRIIKLTKDNYNKIDKIIVSNYGNRDRMFFKNVLALILYFNNLPDINTLKIGMTIKLPDLDAMLLFYDECNLFDEYDGIVDSNDLIPGINMKSVLVTNKNKNSKSNNVTVANPRLNISVKEVTYNKNTGIVNY